MEEAKNGATMLSVERPSKGISILTDFAVLAIPAAMNKVFGTPDQLAPLEKSLG